MEKSILILLLVLIDWQLKAMDNNLNLLGIDKASFAKENNKFAQWEIIKSAYSKLEKDKPSFSSQKWLEISNAYANLIQEYAKDPLWTQYLNSGEVGLISETLSFMGDIEEFLTSGQLILYVEGFLKLIDAYIQEGDAKEAENLIEVGLEINDKLYNGKKIASNMHDKFLDKQAKVRFAIWNGEIRRAEAEGDIQRAYSYAQETLKRIEDAFKDYNNKYPQEIKQLQTKIQTLNQEIEDINKVHEEVKLATMTYTFQNEAHKFLVISNQFLAPLAKRDKKSRDWIINTYNKIINNVDDPTKIKLARQMLEYENAWKGLKFISNKENIEKILEKLDPEFKKTTTEPQNEKNILEALKQLIHSFFVLESMLLKG